MLKNKHSEKAVLFFLSLCYTRQERGENMRRVNG